MKSAPESASQVYLPINIAKSSEVKVTEQEEGQFSANEYADNVYVQVNIERSAEVKVDTELGKGQINGEENIDSEPEKPSSENRDPSVEHLERKIDEETGKVTWTCSICDKLYLCKPKAQIHVMRHFTPQCVCYWCGESFLQAAQLQQACAGHAPAESVRV